MSVEVVELNPVVVEVVELVTSQIEVVELAIGPPGPPGAAGTVFDQTIPAGTWTIPHQLGRLPVVQLYVDQQLIFADVTVTDTTVTVQWAAPRSGQAVLI